MIFAWLRRRRQRAVARRCAQLRAEIASHLRQAAEHIAIGRSCITTVHEKQAAEHFGAAVKLRVLLAHNIEHEDTL